MSNPAEELSNALAAAVERSLNAVVRVEAGRRRAASGVVIGGDGSIVTAAHAVEREEGIEVGLESGVRVRARLVGRDPGTDLALLRVEGEGLAPPPWSAAEPRRGQLVLALSRPGRSLRARAGVVSVLGGPWQSARGARVERYIQSDIGLEPGFSGGALVDVAGGLVGLNSAGLSRGAPIALGQATVARVVAELAAHGRVRRGFLGVSSHPVRLPAEPAERLGRGFGLIVVAVQPAGPADRAGVLLGDVLLSLDGDALEGIDDLQAALESRHDTPATLSLLRAGKEQTLPVTPGLRG